MKFEEIDKLWKLWEIALEDLKECEADPFYDIYMRVWHRRTGNQCQVCVAGAVIAQRIGAKYNEMCLSDFSLPIQKRLKAIDALRCGMINDAFRYFMNRETIWQILQYLVTVCQVGGTWPMIC